MNKIILMCFITLSANVYSQTGFYLRPTIQTKKWYLNREQSFRVTTAQGFVVNLKSDNFGGDAGADLGFCLGYRNKRYFFESGLSQDRTGVGISYRILDQFLIYTTSGSKEFIVNDVIESGGKFTWLKIPVRMGVKLFGNDSITAGRNLRWEGFWYGGIDFLFQYGLTTRMITGHSFFIDEQNHVLSVYYDVGGETKLSRTCLVNTGFMIKTHTKKGRPFLNFSIDFSQSLRPKTIVDQTKIIVVNYDGMSYSSIIKARGSSFTITISKDIYTKNWFKKKQQLEQYK